MKTLAKKPDVKKSNPKLITTDYYLIDHPDANLNWSMNEATYGQLILAKEARAKRRKREKALFFSIGLCLSLLLVIGAFDWKTYVTDDTGSWSKTSDQFENLVDIPQTDQVPPPTPIVDQAQFIEVANEEIIEEKIEINLDVEITEEAIIQQVTMSVPVQAEEEEEKAEEIFTIVEQQPSPVGGMAAFYKYVSENLEYPATASRMDIQGRVFVQFVIEKDGSITDVHVVKGIGAGCDEEAIRVVSQAPPWMPGKQRGRPVRVRMILPIVFKLIS